MSDTVYEASVRIERTRGPHRLAHLPAHEGPVEFGVHGAIAEHYGVSGIVLGAHELSGFVAQHLSG
ncbi:MAG: hypothetical protein F4Z44_02445, partial [Gemmatimonadetes bacterium]|nr:hypothetical protein [Gemmatimonadota bacterium]